MPRNGIANDGVTNNRIADNDTDDLLTIPASTPCNVRDLLKTKPAVRTDVGISDDTVYRGSDVRFPMNDIRKRVWYQGYGNSLNISSSGLRQGFDGSTLGFSAGVDRKYGQYAFVGVGLAGDSTRFEMEGTPYSEDIFGVKGLLYAQFVGSRWYWDIETALGNNRVKSHYSNLENSWETSHWEKQWNIATELGLHWEQGLAKTEPFLAVHRSTLLDYDDDNVLTTVAVGCRHQWRFAGPLAVIRPGIFGGVVHQFEDRLYSTGTFISGTTIYRVPGGQVVQDRVFLGLNLIMSMRKSLDIYTKYTTEFSGGYSSHNVLLGMNWNF